LSLRDIWNTATQRQTEERRGPDKTVCLSVRTYQRWF
jgi:hypothetical protein